MYKIENKKRFAVFVLGILILVVLVFFAVLAVRKKFFPGRQEASRPGFYEVMIQTKGQDEYETEEDRRSFFENGDVVVIFPAGHAWTGSEKEELIVKLELTEEDAGKLLEMETGEIEVEKGEEKVKKDEIMRMRRYRIDLGKIGYKKEKQPGEQKLRKDIFTGDVIEEK